MKVILVVIIMAGHKVPQSSMSAWTTLGGLGTPGPRRHHHDAAREIDALVDRMRDEDDGAAELALQPQDIVVELEAGDLVERGEGLVHEQQLRPQRERAGDRDAHLHAAGQLARIGVRELVEADQREAGIDRLRCRLATRRRAGAAAG
jgi:hypothetical protein